MEKSISRKQIWNQLKADLIGKDSYRGVTLTYSWLANQVGHFSLGFIPTVLLSLPLQKYSSFTDIPNAAAIIVSLTWLSFELYNFLGPLLLKKKNQEKLAFSPPWKNIAFDTFTDLCFFWLGAFCASLYLGFSQTALIMIAVFLIILIYPTYYWYLTKMYLQAAQFPFQMRLSQWKGKANESDLELVNHFIRKKDSGHHLFVFGAKGAGKTSMGVGVASEMAMRRCACSYSTGVKLLNQFFEEDEAVPNQRAPLWSWRKASLMVIDDLNPGDPIKQELLGPDLFLNLLDTFSENNSRNRMALKNKNVIWVLGDKKSDAELFEKWKKMLQKVGVEEQHIQSIHLQ